MRTTTSRQSVVEWSHTTDVPPCMSIHVHAPPHTFTPLHHIRSRKPTLVLPTYVHIDTLPQLFMHWPQHYSTANDWRWLQAFLIHDPNCKPSCSTTDDHTQLTIWLIFLFNLSSFIFFVFLIQVIIVFLKFSFHTFSSLAIYNSFRLDQHHYNCWYY